MDALLEQIGNAVDQLLAMPAVRIGLTVVAGYVVVVWLASALWAFVDMRRRTANLIWPYASAAGVIVATPLLFPLVILVHVVVRPDTTIAERRVNALRDATLGLEIERPVCPRCRRLVDEEWLICPFCRTGLAHRCDRCGHAAGVDWDVCAWCGAALGPPDGIVAR